MADTDPRREADERARAEGLMTTPHDYVHEAASRPAESTDARAERSTSAGTWVDPNPWILNGGEFRYSSSWWHPLYGQTIYSPRTQENYEVDQ